jgi:hypothetical protein
MKSVVLNSTNDNGEVQHETFDKFLLMGFDETGSHMTINNLNPQSLAYCTARLQALFNKILEEEG